MMTEFATIKCKICSLEQIQQNTKLELPFEDALNIIENPVACNKCKVEIDETYQFCMQNESAPNLIKEEFVQDAIKTEGFPKEDSVLINSNVPLYIPVNILHCYECNYSTNDKENLIVHVFAHRFKCNQCGYTTPDNSTLTTHIQIHSLRNSVERFEYETKCEPSKMSDLFECYGCCYRTNCKINLKLHVKMCLNRRIRDEFMPPKLTKCKLEHKCKLNEFYKKYRDDLFCCSKCDFKTHYKGNLRNHKIVHSAEKPFKCNSCDFTTKYNFYLKAHMSNHLGEHRFSCDKCDYKSYTKQHLLRHKIVHSEEKLLKFKCSFKCDYKTYTKQNLASHEKVHSKEKPFKCSLCDFDSRHSSALKRHLNRHSGERNYNCDKCDYRAYTKSELADHQKVHSDEKQFKCSLCGFESKRSLKVHYRNKHSK
ncbi:hypothetical protein FQR65_LT16749 [Abscondita terminalis]|nr:hypothetical protein FQR65_LT16749 [Abscondita terminalis]